MKDRLEMYNTVLALEQEEDRCVMIKNLGYEFQESFLKLDDIMNFDFIIIFFVFKGRYIRAPPIE